jgi:L-alanine-DL-glutamate epimerase-like enolase superfamily enzyme
VAETGTTLRELITKQRLKAEEGYVSMPQEPRLGIDLDDDAIATYCVC